MNLNVDDLLSQSPEDLLADIGQYAELTTLRGTRLPRSQLIEAGLRWLNAQKDALAIQICSDPIVISCRRFPERRLTLIVSIADAIGGLYGNAPVFQIAALLVLEGLDQLCSNV